MKEVESSHSSEKSFLLYLKLLELEREALFSRSGISCFCVIKSAAYKLNLLTKPMIDQIHQEVEKVIEITQTTGKLREISCTEINNCNHETNVKKFLIFLLFFCYIRNFYVLLLYHWGALLQTDLNEICRYTSGTFNDAETKQQENIN